MAIDPNIFRYLQGAAQLAANMNGGWGASGAAAPAGAGQQAATSSPGTMPATTPEQQQILAGANAPSPAAQAAAIQEQRILEGQNPQIAQQAQQQQQQQAGQNTPGGMQPQQSSLGNFSQEQVQAGQQGAQTSSEKGFWDTIKTNLTGEGLQGQDLQDWRKNTSLATSLGLLGKIIGGDTLGGRIGEGAYQLGAGALASKNAELREGRMNDFMQAAYNALARKQPAAQGAAQQTQGSTTTQSQSAQQTLPNGESSLQGDLQGLLTEYDNMLARLHDLGKRV